MRVVCIRQCDVLVEGPGHPSLRTRACFPGIIYRFPDEAVAELIASGHLEALQEIEGHAIEGTIAGAETKVVGRPRGTRKR